MTGEQKNGNKDSSFDSISFVNHISLASTDNSTNFPAVKFDVKIANYSWATNTTNTSLILVFKFQAQGTNQSNQTIQAKNDETVTLDGAYFSINTTATASQGNKTSTVNVKILLGGNADSNSTDNNAGTIWLVYDHFVGSLEHDPELGFGEGPSSGFPVWAIAVIVVVVIIIVGAIVAAVFIYNRNKKQKYQSLL